MDGLVIVGSGGHAKVIIEIIRDAGEFEIVGCIAKDTSGGSLLGIPIVGDDSELPRIHASGIHRAFVAIGENRLREALTHVALSIGFQIVNALSPRAIISRSVRMQEGIAVMAGAVVNSSSSLGAGCIINTGATVDHDCTIGDWAHIAPGTNLAGCVNVGQGAFVGIGARVIPQISIGEWTTVGAGSVVVRDLPPGVVAFGVPAKPRSG